MTACRPRNFHSLIQMITCHLTTKKHVNFNSLRWWFCLFCHVFGGKRHCKSKWDKLLAMYLQLKYTDIMHYSFHTCSCLGRLHAVCLEGFELHVPTLNTYFASVRCLLTSKVITCTVSPVRSQARVQAKPVIAQPSSKSRIFRRFLQTGLALDCHLNYLRLPLVTWLPLEFMAQSRHLLKCSCQVRGFHH